MPIKLATPPINRLILIGNGFDLAHKMKTTYGDFILWYFQKAWDDVIKVYRPSPNNTATSYYQDNLINIWINPAIAQNDPLKVKINGHEDIKSLVTLSTDSFKAKQYNCSIKSEFLRSLVNSFFSKKWVDIENHYYLELTKIINNKTSTSSISGINNSLKKLNNEFLELKLEFEKYLSTIPNATKNVNLEKFIFEKPVHFSHLKNTYNRVGSTMFLNFNYTSTPELYLKGNNSILYMHGKLNDPNNPIIFGYGDERDDTYATLEKANNPEVFTHIKSFDYFKTNNYSKLLSFLEMPYDVYIMGHSCGLSDRTLLSTIFEHDNCRLIKIFYYNDMDRYRETTYEISRHFTSKAEMRRKVINFSDCVPMPQLPS
jgi:hypothetical protein